jgi:hypothetical protein
VRVVELDTHLNDPEVGEIAVSLMWDMLASRSVANALEASGGNSRPGEGL